MAQVEHFLSCGGALDPQALALLARELLAFVLYMHQQMPWTFEELQMELGNLEESLKNQENVKARKSRSLLLNMRKLHKFQHAAESLMLAMETTILNNAPDISAIMLLLGSNVSRPRVIYRLQLHGASKEMTKASARNLSMKMIRELISSEIDDSISGPTTVYVLLEAGAESSMTADFLPKRGLFPNTRKAKQVAIHLLQSKCNAAEISEIDVAQPQKDSIWFLCRYVLKGLLPPLSMSV